jgi:hypothetical protein
MGEDVPEAAYEIDLTAPEAGLTVPTSASPQGPATHTISHGWQFLQRLLSSYSGRLLCGMPDGTLSLAHILARIGESPRMALPAELRIRSQKHLDSLSELGRMDGGWGRESTPDWSDCLTTCWAITALENFGWPVPDESYAFVRACERWDGSFAASPANKQQRSAPQAALAATVTAVRVLREINPRTEEYLVHGLSTAEPAAASYICAEVLDWPAGLASWELLNAASRLTASLFPEDSAGMADLLRCLLRLRLQRSWPVSAQLRKLQQPNGSWIGPAAWLSSETQDKRPPGQLEAALSTASAVASLLLADAQPGLYFGSDLPARRFNEGWRG